MIRVQQLKVPMNHTHQDIEKKLLKLLRIEPGQLIRFQIKKQSIDARKKPDISFSYTVDAEVKNEQSILKRMRNNKDIAVAKPVTYHFPKPGDRKLEARPVIVGAGPAGIFCAYMLAQHGYKPLVLERGRKVEDRMQDVEHFWKTNELNPESNVQFGEGGAGTFSDGKLNTLVKDRYGRNKKVLDLFIDAGAPEEIAYVNKPHIGTDILADVVCNLRRKIEQLGGTFAFETKLIDVHTPNGVLASITVQHNEDEPQNIPASVLVLAIGHSARDTFEMLHKREIPMEAKSFAVGMRVEHPQKMINENQYGMADMQYLPTAAYKLTGKSQSGRGVYSFCMCPGGYVVNASSEPGRLAVNGMSYFKRDSQNANSAIIVSVNPEDFGSEGPLSGVRFQQKLEESAYALGQGAVPQQLYGDFKANRASTGYGAFESCLKGQHHFTNLRELFPEELGESFIQGMESFERYIHGYAREDAILSGVESRTSSPVRINRDEQFESEIHGIYPCGEGAGYAGGIMSAAMDGIKVAEAIAKEYQSLTAVCDR